MVYDGAVKDQESSVDPAAASAAVSEASSSSAVVRETPAARTAHDKRLGVRHPLKHRRFRAGGKMTVEPGGVPSPRAVVEGEEEDDEEEASEVEEVDEEETTSAETEMPSADVEVSSAPALEAVEEMEVEEAAETELSPQAAMDLEESALEARLDEEEEVVSSLVETQGDKNQEEAAETELSPEAAMALEESALEARPDEEEEVVSSLVETQGDKNQEATPAASVPASEEPPDEKDKEREEEEKERERQKERERVDEVGYMSGGWKR